MSWNSCIHTKMRRLQKDTGALKQEADDPAITVEEKHDMSCIAKLKVCTRLQDRNWQTLRLLTCRLKVSSSSAGEADKSMLDPFNPFFI